MKSTLTSVHIWLHRKIRLMEEFIQFVANAAMEAGWLRSVKKYVGEGGPTLEELEQEKDIDNCLKEKISSTERRYAQLVTDLTAASPERLEKLEKMAFFFGKRNCLELDATVSDAWKRLNDMLLEGMPDDPTREVVERAKDRISWKQIKDVHSDYWLEAGGFPSDFQKMRKQFIDGILSQSDIHVEEVSPVQFVLVA